mgnify:CR=1 FL=1
MPKLVMVHRQDEISKQAHDYVKSYILLPSGLLGLVSMVGGVGALGYQLIATDNYTWMTFYQSSGLVLLGVVMGIAQTKYQQYLFRQFPDVFAARMRLASIKKGKKPPADSSVRAIEHPGRGLVPVAYLVGGGLLVGASAWCGFMGQVIGLAALLMPWVGFYWARLFFWRKVVS